MYAFVLTRGSECYSALMRAALKAKHCRRPIAMISIAIANIFTLPNRQLETNEADCFGTSCSVCDPECLH